MNSFLRLICCTIILGLCGCQGLQQNALKGQALAQCNMTCVKHFEFCKQNCINNCPNCSYISQRVAEKTLQNMCMKKELRVKR